MKLAGSLAQAGLPRSWWVAVLLTVCAALSGCAGFEQVTASRRDYLLYRETRAAASPELRLSAAARYLREMPEGAFRERVAAWFRVAEPRFYALAHDRPSLLRAYQRALPDGPHANDVARRLDEFAQLNRLRSRREAASEHFIERVTSDLGKAEAGRQALLGELRELSRLLAATQKFGVPTSELDHELVYRLRLVAPAGVCDDAGCLKQYEIAYGVPDGGRIVPRSAKFTLAVGLERGLVTRVRVAGNGLWSHLGEAVDKLVVDDEDLQARAESIGRASALVESAIDASLPSAECRQDVVAPVVLARRCRGVELVMSVGIAHDDVDYLEMRPAPAVAAPAAPAKAAGKP